VKKHHEIISFLSYPTKTLNKHFTHLQNRKKKRGKRNRRRRTEKDKIWVTRAESNSIFPVLYRWKITNRAVGEEDRGSVRWVDGCAFIASFVSAAGNELLSWDSSGPPPPSSRDAVRHAVRHAVKFWIFPPK